MGPMAGQATTPARRAERGSATKCSAEWNEWREQECHNTYHDEQPCAAATTGMPPTKGAQLQVNGNKEPPRPGQPRK